MEGEWQVKATALDNYRQLAAEIRQGKLANLYLLYGEEQALAESLVELLVERLLPAETRALNYRRLDGRKMTDGELMSALQTPPMFGSRCLVVVDQPGFLVRTQEVSAQLTRLFAEWPEDSCAVFLAPQVDKRLKLVKQLLEDKRAYEFSPLTAAEAARWVDDRLRRGGVPHRGLGRQVVEQAGSSLGVLRLEVEKLIAYAAGQPLQREDVWHLVRKNPETSIFDLVDAVGQRRLQQALHLLDQLQMEGQAPLYILSMISRQMRLLLSAREELDRGASDQQAAATLGIHRYPAGKCVVQAKQWTAAALRRAVSDCLAMDEAIKTGQLTDRRALDQLLLNLAQA
jgi:DNA polymerase-3 subunit delta